MKAILTKDVYRTKDAAQPDLNFGRRPSWVRFTNDEKVESVGT